jgi:hypothetical protein
MAESMSRGKVTSALPSFDAPFHRFRPAPPPARKLHELLQFMDCRLLYCMQLRHSCQHMLQSIPLSLWQLQE